MAGKNQQLPRICICKHSQAVVVPNTLLEVKFVQRGGKLYKILLPNLLKHNNPTNVNISQPATSPIVFEARNAKGLENTRKLNEPSPFLKPVTLSSTEYKAIPLFKRGERIVDTNWLPEETECIIQLVKSHKAFQDANTTSTENLLPKIVSVNSSEVTKDTTQINPSLTDENLSTEFSSTNQTVHSLLGDVSEMVEGQRNFVSAFAKSHEELTMVQNFEKITPVCELKVEPLNGENCILSDIKHKLNLSLNKNTKPVDVQANNTTSPLTASIDANSENLKTVGALPNGRYGLSLKENNVALVENAKLVPPIEKASEGSILDSSNEEKALLLEKLKNARTIKIKPHGSNSASTEETKPILQADLGEMNAKEFKSETGSSAMSLLSTNTESETVTSVPIETAAVSQAQKKVMLRLQRAENSTNICGVTAEIALIDHDYALKVDKQPTENSARGRTVSNYSLRSVLRPKSQSTDMYTYPDSDKLSKNSLTKARGRKPALNFHGITQNQKCGESTNIDKSVTMAVNENIFHLQHQKSIDGKPSLTFTSPLAKQNSIALGKAMTTGNANLIKGVIKLLMPKSFSNTCSSQDTAQALNRIAKLKASGVYQGPINSNVVQCKYNKTCNKQQILSNAQIITVSNNPSENTMCVVSNKDHPPDSDSSSTEEEFNIMEPEVLITESDGIFIIEDGKLKLCPPRKKPVRKKRNSKKLQKNNETKHPINHINSKKSPDEAKKVTNDVPSTEASNEEKDSENLVPNKETSNPSLKRMGKYLESVQNTKYQRETLLPPAPKVRKLFICRTEKTASSLLQSCFVWLDKMDDQFLDDGRLDTTEISEDILFNVRDTSHPYTKSQYSHKHYTSKAAYLDEDPIVIIEPSSSKPAGAKSEVNNSPSIEIVDRKEADNRMADVLRLLEEKRKAIEVLRQKNMSHSIAPTVSQTLN